MWIINSIAGVIIDAALWPFRSMSPMVGLTAFSVISGIGMLYVFKWTSDQTGIDKVKRRIHAGLFEIRLFNDDMRAIFAAQRDILVNNVRYVRLSLRPLMFMIVPFVLIIAQLQLHYGYEGLQVGEPAIVKVTFADDASADAAGEQDAEATARATARRPAPDVHLEVPEGLRLDTPRVWAAPLNQAAWRIVPEVPGDYELEIRVGDEQYSKSVTVSDRVVKRSPIRSDSLLDQILYPGEPGFPSDAPVAAIEVMYPEAEVNFLGWHTHWIIAFFIITIVLAFALRKPLGVTF
jgi:uncharacterized membrane protein (DUF106 family)